MDENEKGLNVGWSHIDGEGLVRVVPTGSFREGFVLVGKLAELAEQLNHDPDVLLSNQKVVITLYSHDVNDVTERDYEFAKRADKFIPA
jgi:4a-hydroxytetrahydrobiopterin dehydratase